MLITRKKLQKFGAKDHRERTRLNAARLKVGQSFHWPECSHASSAAQVRQMLKRWGLTMTFAHEPHPERGFVITRVL